jgi:hypothetical protein
MLTSENAASFLLCSCSFCAASTRGLCAAGIVVAVCMSREGPAQQGVYQTHLTCVASLQARGKVQISSMHVGGNKINAQNTHLFTKIVCDDSDIRIELRHEMMGRSRPCFNTFYRLLLLLVMLQEYGAVCF